jgi:hypothetical protein
MQQLKKSLSSRWGRGALRSLARALGLGVLASGVGLGLALATQACSSENGDSTGGKRVVLHTRVTIEPAALETFESALGWQVTLSKALTSAGPFYYFDGTPPLVLGEQARGWQYAARWLGLGRAHAHPGHYQAGNALGEMREASSLDLLAGAVDFPDGNGVSGIYRSARFTFSEPTGPAEAALGGHSVVAEGLAEKGEERRYFRAVADLAGIEKSAADGHVEGCEFNEVDVQDDGTVTATINPVIWFDLVDFTDAEVGSADAPAELPAGSQPRIAFLLGVTQLSAYKFRYSK